MSLADHLGHLEREVDAFDHAWAAVDPEAPVPPCPDWSARDLRDHVAEVLAFWHAQLGPGASLDGPVVPADLDQQSARGVADLGRQLVTTLRRIGPDQPTWNWSGAALVSGWVGRRMAQELAVHRVDAQLAAGGAEPIDPVLSRDGIDELLDVFLDADPGVATDGAPVLELQATDSDHSWTIAVTGEGVRRVEREAGSSLTGSASDIVLALWTRPSPARWAGDPEMPRAWREMARIE